MSRRWACKVASLLLLALLVPVFNSLEFSLSGISLSRVVPQFVPVQSETAESSSLAQIMQRISAEIDWGEAVYSGVLFNKRNVSDLEALIDGFAARGDWLNVLKWTVICRKLGVEREDAIKAALDGLPMVGPLPWTTNYGGANYFCTEQKFALVGYYYAEKYDFRADKWNKTEGYEYFKATIAQTGHPVLFIGSQGDTFTISYGPRYYDESACTVQCFLVFYEMGVTQAVEDALSWWNWINNNLWYEGTHYKYALNWPNYECEAGSFAKIVSDLKFWCADLGNWTRVLNDLQNRFLVDGWNSKQWLGYGETTFVVVHHYPSNFERRLLNTLNAWTSMLSLYGGLNKTSRNGLQDLLLGSDLCGPAWKQLMSSAASLYDSDVGKFRLVSDGPASDEATAYALMLMFFQGIVPKTTSVAFPIEEYAYEYVFDVDPELCGMNFETRTIRVPVQGMGKMEFIYGTSSVLCSFTSGGVFEIAFSEDWNKVTRVSKLQDLPNNRRYLLNAALPEHDLGVVEVLPLEERVVQGSTLNVSVTLVNLGRSAENSNVTLFAGSFPVQSRAIAMESGESVVTDFSWNLTGVRKGDYELSAVVDGVFGESDLSDNIRYSDSMVTVVVLGHDVAVESVSVCRRLVNVAVQNFGDGAENVNLTVYADVYAIFSENLSLPSGESATVVFTWHVNGFAEGNYSLRVYAGPVDGEVDLADNVLSGGWVIVVKGDANGDESVDLFDCIILFNAFDSYVGDKNWDVDADFNCDNVIDIFDALTLVANFGK